MAGVRTVTSVVEKKGFRPLHPPSSISGWGTRKLASIDEGMCKWWAMSSNELSVGSCRRPEEVVGRQEERVAPFNGAHRNQGSNRFAFLTRIASSSNLLARQPSFEFAVNLDNALWKIDRRTGGERMEIVCSLQRMCSIVLTSAWAPTLPLSLICRQSPHIPCSRDNLLSFRTTRVPTLPDSSRCSSCVCG